MKKVSFGSFPLTEIKKEDRKCLDRYLIKSFADNISISDAIRNLALTKNLMYITPDSMIRDFAGLKGDGRESKNDRSSNHDYEAALKRAFYILKEFYSTVSKSPFYKEFVYYPIYVEKIERFDKTGTSTEGAKTQKTNIMMNYSFIVLSNDLTKSLKIDEIRYDENASLNFLFLFVEFFSGDGMDQSIHNFGQQDYEFLVRMYQFVEKSNKEPIEMVLDLYKIIGLLDQVQSNNNQEETRRNLNKFLGTDDVGSLRKYTGLLRHRFQEMIKRGNTGDKTIRDTFIKIMSDIFDSEGLSGLYNGVDNNASRGERYQHVYNTSKYREILNLANELVEYNKLGCKQVVSDDNLDIDFKVENSTRTLDVRTGEVAQKYQTFFKDYVQSIRTYLEGITGRLIDDFKIGNSLDASFDGTLKKADSHLKALEKRVADLKDEKIKVETQITKLQANPNSPAILAALDRLNDNLLIIINDLDIAEMAVQQQENFIDSIKHHRTVSTQVVATTEKDTNTKLVDYLMSSLATDLAFAYDDGKRFFTNEMIAQGLVDLADNNKPKGAPESGNYNLTEPEGFQNAVKNVNNTSIFKPNLNPDAPDMVNNPSYLAASVAVGLNDTFDALAKTAVAEMKNNLSNTVQRNVFNGLKTKISNVKDVNDIMDQFSKNLAANEKYIKKYDEFEKQLKEKIFRDKFLEKVLTNFLRMFAIRDVDQVIKHDESVGQMHPVIQKLLKDGSNCQFFKSFIIEHEMIEQLYRLKYITDTQKFLDGITNRAPRKFNDPMNRMQTVLNDYLGLENNPTWVTSETNIYLSMPDGLSLTGTSILSNIPQADLMDVCRIDPRSYWDGQKMGKVAQVSGNKSKAAQKKIDDIDAAIKKLSDKRGGADLIGKKTDISKKPDPVNVSAGTIINLNQKITLTESNDSVKKNDDKAKKELELLRKRRDKAEEELMKAKEDDKFLPNMNIFTDPARAEKEEFISDKERSELIQNRDTMEERLLELNPYDDADIKEMASTQQRFDDNRERERRENPFSDRDEHEGPDQWNNMSSRESENEEYRTPGERSERNAFNDRQDNHGYDIRDRMGKAKEQAQERMSRAQEEARDEARRW